MARGRSRVQIIEDNITKIDEKIQKYEEKISELNSEKETLTQSLEEAKKEEDKARKEAEAKEIMDLMQKKNLSLDQLKEMLIGSSEAASTEEQS